MKKITLILSFFLLFVSLCSCKANQKSQLSSSAYIESMDTVMSLTAYGSNRSKALDEAIQEIKKLNTLLNTEDPSSEISILNQNRSASLSPDSANLVEKSLELYKTTNGYFDITVYPVAKLWGFPSKNYRVPTAAEIEAELQNVGSDRISYNALQHSISLEPGQAIGFGGIAKGYTSQKIMDIFRKHDIKSGLVSLGGNVQCLGTKPDGSLWKVGIQNPFNSEEVYGVLAVQDCAVITSGGYERFFTDESTGKTYRHIIDPKTGSPADNDLASVTIISSDGSLGDGLSTALYVMGLNDAIAFWESHSQDFEAVFIDNNGKIYATDGVKDALTSHNAIDYIGH